MPDPTPVEQSLRARAVKLREGDLSPTTREEWTLRQTLLRKRMFAAMGPMPEKPCELQPKDLGKLERDGYRIEKLIFQSRPDVWVTATAYVPATKEKVPAVLVVHGHWAWARRDPVVQARCLGLVKLGFFVLAIDAFGSGERYTAPARGTYHGSLYGSTLWPTGHTLLGMQVYDNRRAVDYLVSRPEVNGKLGITGASGGGNQSMYAGALDERIQAVVPVCSVGNYQAYLHAACCVCEVLPNALTFTEEGDVLGLVAPRALLVMNASRDAIQFSPPEAEKSLSRAKDIFKLLGEETKVKHVVVDSGHDYNLTMREAMYGWMTLHLKGEGKGEPIAEPKHTLETPEDLACFPKLEDRPKSFLTPPLFAGVAGRSLMERFSKLVPNHLEMWEATADAIISDVKKLLGPMPKEASFENVGEAVGGKQALTLTVEPGITLAGFRRDAVKPVDPPDPTTLIVGFTPLDEEWLPLKQLKGLGSLVRFELRGQSQKSGAIAGAPDHTVAEHGVWTGRTSLAQWVADTVAMLRATETPQVVVGLGPGAMIAALASVIVPELVKAVILVKPMTTYVTDVPYATGTHMGLLVPGILNVGDVPQLVSLTAPRRLIIAGGLTPQGHGLTIKELEQAFRFTTSVFNACKAPDYLTLSVDTDWSKVEI